MNGQAMTRRSAMTAGAVSGAAGLLSLQQAAASDAVAGLIKIAEEKNAAFMTGDMARWARLARIAPDFTLMQPFGGAASHGFDAGPEKLSALSRYFRNGKATLEVVETYASDDLVVLVTIERQRGEVGGLPEQDWSLRVTEVFRKDADGWSLVHRHADPLVRRITLEQAAELARGQLSNG